MLNQDCTRKALKNFKLFDDVNKLKFTNFKTILK